jgi:hypothetical protein
METIMKHQYWTAALALVAATALSTSAWAASAPAAAAPASTVTEAAPSAGDAPAVTDAKKPTRKAHRGKKGGERHKKRADKDTNKGDVGGTK